MITFHHSFSTRIFLQPGPGAGETAERGGGRAGSRPSFRTKQLEGRTSDRSCAGGTVGTVARKNGGRRA